MKSYWISDNIKEDNRAICIDFENLLVYGNHRDILVRKTLISVY